MSSIPAKYVDLLTEKRTIAHLATLLPDGTPHVSPVWIDYDESDDRVLVNTERGRVKDRNVREDPRVGLSMTDPDDPYRRFSIIGAVTDLTEEGARDHIDYLEYKYRGADEYTNPIRTARVIMKIRVDSWFD